jgi:hypothetical protein
MCLRTFDSPYEASRSYDVAAWRFGRRRGDMNFPKIKTREDVKMFALPLTLTTLEEKHRHHHQ